MKRRLKYPRHVGRTVVVLDSTGSSDTMCQNWSSNSGLLLRIPARRQGHQETASRSTGSRAGLRGDGE